MYTDSVNKLNVSDALTANIGHKMFCDVTRTQRDD
jgi:hypothetical protein